MTYKRHWLLSWGGTVGNGSDVFANNVRMMNDELADSDNLDDGQMESLLDDFVTDIRTFITSADSFISSSVECNWVKFNEIGPDGHYVNQTKTHVRFLSGTTGASAVIKGVTGATIPTFQSVCVTTTTARQRGPASKGRLFLPQCAIPLDASGRIITIRAAELATRTAAFLTALGDEAGIDTTAIAPAVISNVGSPGPQERITGVKVGNVPDVIRRRKNAMTEVYSSASVSTA